jgi:hypothetical protein
MQKIQAPAAGLLLNYDFSPGQSYFGHIARSETMQLVGMAINITRSISFDVRLTVSGPDPERGGTRLIAKISNVNMVWGSPPASPVSVAEIKDYAIKNLEGAEVDFSVDERGEVIYMPGIPAEVSPELTMAIQQALDALEFSFYQVPERALKIGESWTDEHQKGRKGKLGRYINGQLTTTVEGLYTLAEDGTEVAQLESKETEIETTTAKSGSHEVKREGKAKSLFATKDGYLRMRESNYTTFDTGKSTTFAKLSVTWKKTGKKTVAAPAKVETQTIKDPCSPDYVGPEECAPVDSGATETQSITDPCDPNYVGPAECAPAAADAEQAPAGDAAPKTPG